MMEIENTERYFLFENYQKTVCDSIINYLNKQVLVNITLVCKGEIVKAHQIILSACSTFFENILTEQKQLNPIVVLSDIAKNEMMLLLQYMYMGRVNVPDSLLPSVLKAAKKLQIKGLNYEAFDNIQNGSEMNPGGAKNATHSLSRIFTESDHRYLNAKPQEQNHPIPVMPERSRGKRFTVKRKSKENDNGKAALNPFAKKPSSCTDSDSTVFECNISTPGPSKRTKTTSSPIHRDSDIEFIDIMPVVANSESPSRGVSRISEIVKKYLARTPTNSDKLSEVEEFNSDESDLLPAHPKKTKIDRKAEQFTDRSPIKLNPVALNNKRRDGLVRSNKSLVEYFQASNSHEDNSNLSKRQNVLDKSNTNQNKNTTVPKHLKRDNKRHLSKMSLYDLRNFCVICLKKRRNIREHIRKIHCVPPRGKHFFCEFCCRRYNFQKSLTLHNCNG